MTVPFTEFRQHSSQYIDAVEAGESVTIIRNSKPVAKIVPIAHDVAKKPIWKRPGLLLKVNFSASDMIIKEREER